MNHEKPPTLPRGTPANSAPWRTIDRRIAHQFLVIPSGLHLPKDDPRQGGNPDISKARKALEWEPRTPLVDGLAKTIGYFDELLKDGNTFTSGWRKVEP